MSRSTRLAVLIDAENIGHNLADQVFALVEPLGTVTVRRIYGDFAGQAGSWTGAAARHALQARHCFAPVKGKNGADIALAVDAMVILRDGAADGICVVSSDSDFTALMRQIREEGRLAYGIGRGCAAEDYRKACTRFLTLHPPMVAAKAPPAPVATALPKPHPALAVIRRALAECAAESNGSYNLCRFGDAARRNGIDPKAYGAAGLAKLLAATGHYTIAGQHFRPVTPRAVASGQ